MYKNQLQELAQRSCFNLPSYTCIREGPDHAPRFKATVNFNGESFESPSFCTTLRQAEHSAAEVALNALASGGQSNSLAARILDETGVYKNLLQEVSQRVGASLPTYKTFRTGHGHHLPAFSCTVELAGIRFTGEPAKNKKQAEKNAAMAAWLSLKQLLKSEGSSSEKAHSDEQEHITVARSLQNFLWKAKISKASFPIRFPSQNLSATSPQPTPVRASKILPLIYSKTTHSRPITTSVNNSPRGPKTVSHALNDQPISPRMLPPKFCAAEALPYIPMRHFRPHHAIAPPVTIRNAIPVFSAPPLPTPPSHSMQLRRPPPPSIAPPVCLRQTAPVFAAPPVCMEERPVSIPPLVQPTNYSVQMEKKEKTEEREAGMLDDLPESVVLRELLELKI